MWHFSPFSILLNTFGVVLSVSMISSGESFTDERKSSLGQDWEQFAFLNPFSASGSFSIHQGFSPSVVIHP